MSKITKNNFFDYLLKVKKGFKIQANVLRSLTYRELITRASLVKFGYIGLFLEPLGVMSIFLIIFSLIRRRNVGGNLDVLIFLISGIVLYTLFNAIAIRSMNAMAANKPLFFYKQIQPIDTIFSRTLVEVFIYLVIFILLVLMAFLIREIFYIDDFPLICSSFLLLVIYSCGIGIFLMIANFRYAWIKSVVSFLMRPLWFVSGVFFSLNDIPQNLRPYISWNPILQAIELIRHGFSNSYPLASAISLIYLFQVSLIVFTISLWLYNKNAKILRTR